MGTDRMIKVENLGKHYLLSRSIRDIVQGRPGKTLRAVDGVNFPISAGEVVGLVGESGCGKSTLARLLVGLEQPTLGSVQFDGISAQTLQQRNRRAFHRRVQMVFQDPYGSLNPQHKIGEIVVRPLIYQKARLSVAERHNLAIEALEEAGLSPASDYLNKFPHQLSGGQRQRVCIARAIVLGPELLVADEPISMLDVSIKWGIIQLLKKLVRDRNLAMVYITHDLSSAAAVCDRLSVMYLGQIVETGPNQDVISNPQHPYTRALLASTPALDPDLKREAAQIKGAIPNASNMPSGCRFHPRCPMALPVCAQRAPEAIQQGNHYASCRLAFEPVDPLPQAEAAQ